MKIRNALLSVFHKDGIIEFARVLIRHNINLFASGGTAKHLKEAGLPVTDVATLVGGGAILNHRVVTLSREIHAGLLARLPEDAEEMKALGLPYFELVCVDLYPLEAEIARPGSTLASVIEKTDIGGPTMLRSAAKGRRLDICDPADRQRVVDWLDAGQPDDSLIEELAAKAEFVISKYCMASAAYRSHGNYAGVLGTKVLDCKYGENAHQKPAALFSAGTSDPLALDAFKVIHGDAPSYNNLCDVDRLLQTMTHVAAALEMNHITSPRLIALGAKHGNMCGASISDTAEHAVSKMMHGDQKAIFGGLIMTNFPFTDECAEPCKVALDGIIAPSIHETAVEKLERKKTGKCRFVVNEALGSLTAQSLDTAPRFRYVRGGMLRQPNYSFVLDLKNANVQRYGPDISDQQTIDLLLAWAIGSTSNSNTITLVKEGMLIGNGVGQQDRVGAARLAISRAAHAGHVVYDAVAYSDSFFPFPDGPELLIAAGVRAILTSSGSIRDEQTIQVCKTFGISLLMVPDQLGRGFFGH